MHCTKERTPLSRDMCGRLPRIPWYIWLHSRSLRPHSPFLASGHFSQQLLEASGKLHRTSGLHEKDANSDHSYTSLQANYLTIPVYALATLTVALTAWVSDRLHKRAYCLLIVPIPVLIGYAIVIGTSNHGAGYFAMFLCGAGIYPYNCLMLT